MRISSSSSSCHAICTDIPDPFSPPLPMIHYFRQVFSATSRIGTELLYVASSWSSCLYSSMRRGPQEYIPYELVSTSPAVSCMSSSSNFYSFHDGWLVAVQPLLCGVLPSGLVQYCSNGPQTLGKNTRKIGNQRKNRDHPPHDINWMLRRVLKTWEDLLWLRLQ